MRRTAWFVVLAACHGNGPSLAPDASPGADAAVDAVEPTCGAGTIEIDHTCFPATTRRFEIRIDEIEVGANGRTRREVLVVGVEPDGSAVRERVIVALDRASAGTLEDRFLTLGAHGATTTLTPCLDSTPDCLGAATLTLALASDPETVVATAAISLVAPINVSSVAPCVDRARRFHLQHGPDTFEAEEGAWFVTNQFSNSLALELTPIADDNLRRAVFTFDSVQVGVPLAPGIFDDVRRASSQTPGHPGLEVIANSLGCNQLTGRFQIHHYTRDTGTSTFDLLVSFEQFCDADPVPLEGCVRYTP